MSLENLVAKIVASNQSAREADSNRLARLIDITAMGTADDLSEFTAELLDGLAAKDGGPDGEDPEAPTVDGVNRSAELAE